VKRRTILLELRPPNSFYDIRAPFLKAMYLDEKEKLDLEIMSIPLVKPSEECDVFDVDFRVSFQPLSRKCVSSGKWHQRRFL